MKKVFLYSSLLILGILCSQFFDLSPLKFPINLLTMTFLGYIMIEVGLEFSLNKRNIRSYGKDYLIATTAAALPWILCTIYFWLYFDIDLTDASIIGRFAAPTSAGVLFTMLAAAGLATTWVFKKARILAILDDLDTILLIIPLQMIRMGFDIRSLVLIIVIMGLLVIAWTCLHRFSFPTSRPALLIHSAVLVTCTEVFQHFTLIGLEILLPAFVLGCIIKNPHLDKTPTFITAIKHKEKHFDMSVKLFYMFLVGCSLPPISFDVAPISFLITQVLIVTMLSNFGKLYPMICYKKDASLRERTALSIAMWPRGEVGAGILIISLNYNLPSLVIEIAELSLALNLTLTGLFIYIVIWLLKKGGHRHYNPTA